MKKLSKLLLLFMCCVVMLYPIPVHATEINDSSSIDQDTSSSSATSSDSEDTDSDADADTDTDDTDSDSDTASVNSKIMLADNWKIPTVTYGQKVNIVLPLVNMDKYTITDVIISPVIATDTASFPFEIEKTGYAVELTELLGSSYNSDPLERRQEVTYTFTARDDISTGYYAINFEAIFKNANGTEETATITTYVKAIGKKGAAGNSDAVSVPRVIVTGFSTSPEDVRAGEDFTLTLHIQNTSQNTAISNIKCDLEAATDGTDENAVTEAFLPKAGSSTIFIDSIGKGETKDISIEMNAKASLTQKPYVLSVKMDYEDESYNQYTSDANVSIPVIQEAKFEMSDPEIMPASIEVGSESNVMFSIYNTGKTTMYNVSVKFEADSVTGGDTFVGKINIGETGNVDAMLTGAAATEDEGAVKILITYEDEAGNATTVERSLDLMVSAETEIIDDMDMDFEGEDYEEESSFPVWIIAVIVIVAAGAGAGTFFYIRKKKKKDVLENELLDDIEDDDDEIS
ncbi:COG1361 S-layer family protein [Konateibacter massiliensis]|uniref:COG1361 S-layer family protein n=1 Tax=Konateibacter massiliensis TaxID=2002841 RepID=UPI000C15598C|nr:CARDB domain-containing protein [Konateibacter massiliensis]